MHPEDTDPSRAPQAPRGHHVLVANDLVIGGRPKRERKPKPNVKRAIKDVQAAGFDPKAVKITTDSITVEIGKGAEQTDSVLTLADWRGRRRVR